MGGIGSGRSGGKPKVESCASLSIGELLRAGALQAGGRHLVTWSWTDRFSGGLKLKLAIMVDLTDPRNAVVALLRLSGARTTADQRIELVGVPQPFGGLRWWFVCGQTGRRHGMLLLPPGAVHFGSRHSLRARPSVHQSFSDGSGVG